MIQGIKLSELSNKISQAINEKFHSQRFWIIADITNHSFKPDKQIHYFELVEKDSNSNSIIARISGKAWGAGAVSLSDFEKNTGQKFSNNINVLVQVTVQYHASYGLALNVVDIDQNFTLGLLEQQRNATLLKLVDENDFITKDGDVYITRNSQLTIKSVIQRVALLSSSGSAGAEDFKHTLENNSFGYKFIIDEYFALVQGDNNAKQFLNKLIEIFNSNKDYDAVIITRGGGAQTDFLIFDNYHIGRAVAKFPIPIITGIGHQKNITILDMMAHTQTKTPTKAAEFIIAHNRDFEHTLLQLQKTIIIKSQQIFFHHFQLLEKSKINIATNVRNLIHDEKESLTLSNQTIVNSSKSVLYNNERKLIAISAATTSRPKITVYNRINDIKNTISNLKTFTAQYIRNQKGYIGHYSSSVKMMAPENILNKGYAIIKVEDKITSDPSEIKVGTDINIILADTLLKTTVKQKLRYDGNDTNI